MPNYTLSNRLMTAVDFVRCGKVFADVGTDHGYLPIFLYKKGIIKRAVASDINSMPLERAKHNISVNGAEDGIDTVLSDGLCEIEHFAPDDIAIFGMGGELVCKIISEAEWTKNKNIRLILQPMTKQEEVRRFLIDEGYSIIGEKLSLDDGKFYQTICAEYSENTEKYSDSELILGKFNIQCGGELFRAFVTNRIDILKTRLKGKRTVGLGDEEERMIKEFEKILERIK